jgi:hypothetical protein
MHAQCCQQQKLPLRRLLQQQLAEQSCCFNPAPTARKAQTLLSQQLQVQVTASKITT